jgi:hypothetical protein
VLRFRLMVNEVCVNSLKHQEKHSMKHYAGLDVSVKETSICIVDETGKICRERKVPSHPEDLLRILQDPALNLARVGLEAGPLSQWLFNRLTEAGLPVVGNLACLGEQERIYSGAPTGASPWALTGVYFWPCESCAISRTIDVRRTAQ